MKFIKLTNVEDNSVELINPYQIIKISSTKIKKPHCGIFSNEMISVTKLVINILTAYGPDGGGSTTRSYYYKESFEEVERLIQEAFNT